MATRYPVYGGVADYNPQDWRQNAPAPGSFRSHADIRSQVVLTADLTTGPIPSPPPPYSPSDSPGAANPASLNAIAAARHTASPANAAMFGTPISAVSTNPPFSPLRLRQNSLSGAANPTAPANNGVPTFAPPPNSTRDRSSSRTRDAQRGLFGLSALRNRSTDRLGSSAAPANNTPQSAHPSIPRAANPLQYAPHQQYGDFASNRMTMQAPQPYPDVTPPAARRSASAGDARSGPYSSVLPPPPPGPPPSSSRSMSTDRGAPNPVPILAMPTRRPPHRGTALGPVPPTPANWTDDPQAHRPEALRADSIQGSRDPSPLPPLRVATGADHHQGAAALSENQVSEHMATESVSSSESWQRVVRREPSIRERRSESRRAQDRVALIEEPLSIVPNRGAKSNDLPLRSPGSGGINRMGAVKKTRHVPSPLASPGNLGSATGTRQGVAPTPPFSPAPTSGNAMSTQFSTTRASGSKALPTPPPTSRNRESAEPGIPLSTPLSPRKFGKTPINTASPQQAIVGASDSLLKGFGEDAENFMTRCQKFAMKEQKAASDQERLELFAQFFVYESRLRRDKYAAAFSGMAGEVYDLTRDMWKSLQPTPTKPPSEPPMSAGSQRPPSRQNSMDSHVTSESPYSTRAAGTPATEAESPADSIGSTGPKDGPTWKTYQPVLSPIPSMAMSTVPDEEESRGRAPSRWWESSQGSQANDRAQQLERSKRESKYMSLQRDGRNGLQWENPTTASPGFSLTPRATPMGPGGYPVEKSEWADELTPSNPHTTGYQLFNASHSSRSTPDPHKLDVSRLVTLPPPYPRHYPAMNNNHPDLATVRTTLRGLTELEEIAQTKTRFSTRVEQERERLKQEAADRKVQMRHNIQEQVSLGQMSYADAAAAESDFHKNEAREVQRAVKREFNEFQPEVMTPLHAMLSERITKATACLTQLEESLKMQPHDLSRNQQLQEEGDERPELLEKLNLLKWLFDAREALHREMFTLEADRDDRYKAMVLTPLRVAGDQARLAEVMNFFQKDKNDRQKAFGQAKIARWEAYAQSIEEHVTRGAEDQLNAFWDIAPGLLEIVDQVPENLDDAVDHHDFSVQVPENETEENPSYAEHPLQYLYSLLSHAEKSAYQFIEAQTNLLCLQHEALSGAAAARFSELAAKRREEEGVEDGQEDDLLSAEMASLRGEEEGRLTNELKDKVALVESQWREALGAGLGECRERVERYLVGRGGWDEMLAE